MSDDLSGVSTSRLRSALVEIYGGQTARTVVGDDGLVEYAWGDGLPVVQTDEGARTLSRAVKNMSGTWNARAGSNIDTDTWTTSANRDAEFRVEGIYRDETTDAPALIDALRQTLQSGTSGNTTDTSDPVEGARSHRDVLTPEESGGLVSEPVDVSGITSTGVTSMGEISTGGLSGRMLAVGAALVAVAVAVFGSGGD